MKEGIMQKTGRLLSALVVASLLVSCASMMGSPSIEISTSGAQGSGLPLSRIYFVVDVGDNQIPTYTGQQPLLGDHISLGKYIADSFESKKYDIGAEYGVYRISGLELNESEINDRIASFAPDAVVLIKLRQANVYSNNVMESGTFEILVYKGSIDTQIWKATVRLEPSELARGTIYGPPTPATIDALLEKLLSSMKSDNILK
jgi:hypothetical protein